MDGLAVSKQGPSQIVQVGQLAEEEVVDYGANEVNRVGRTPGDVEGFDAEGVPNAFVTAGMGPRILRAQTAAVAACTLVQYLYGDMGTR